ncbi:uncharacterized protein TNCV_3494311 [Trichonephila clavipes]|nr:uncharacterized protein TNCV_3494311 [Trichonephila clavipes]
MSLSALIGAIHTLSSPSATNSLDNTIGQFMDGEKLQPLLVTGLEHLKLPGLSEYSSPSSTSALRTLWPSRQHLSPFWRFSLELNTRIRPLGLIPPSEHDWYQCSRPGGSLAHGFTRQDQTLLARFQSGHIKTMKFSEGCKSFEMCTNCSSEPATPAHILECLGLTKQDLADDPLLVLDFLKVCDVMDLV